MAKAAAKAKTEEADDAEAPKKGKGKRFLIIGLIVVLSSPSDIFPSIRAT